MTFFSEGENLGADEIAGNDSCSACFLRDRASWSHAVIHHRLIKMANNYLC